MKVKIYIALTFKMRINTHFKNTLTNYTKYDLSTKRLVLLPVHWEKWFTFYEAAPYNN